jgi:hypothetical protein
VRVQKRPGEGEEEVSYGADFTSFKMPRGKLPRIRSIHRIEILILSPSQGEHNRRFQQKKNNVAGSIEFAVIVNCTLDMKARQGSNGGRPTANFCEGKAEEASGEITVTDV